MTDEPICISGWGQVIQRPNDREAPVDPIGLMAKACRKACDTAGITDIATGIDGLMVVRILSRLCPCADKALSETLDITPGFSMVSSIGGNSPQALVNRAAGMIARGEAHSVLIAGAETYRTRNASPGKNALFQGTSPDLEGDDFRGSTPWEEHHGIHLPIHGFPLFETALWAQSGRSRNEYLMDVGRRWSDYSRIAAGHPSAWTSVVRSAEEIITPSMENRMIAFPYTKFMNPFINVDLGAAIVVTREKKAAQGKSLHTNRVYFRGGGYAEDRQRFLIEKSDFTTSPPLRKAVGKALDRSGISLDRISCFDFYSCFPCAVAVAERDLGLHRIPGAPHTLTGGLGFFGGPGNNYSLHAIATLAGMIAEGKQENGMITALGWFMHKQAAGIYSRDPGDGFHEQADVEDMQNPLTGLPPVLLEPPGPGTGSIETYTVLHSHEGRPVQAVIYGRSPSGRRFIARSTDPNLMDALMTECRVGEPVRLSLEKASGHLTAELT